MVLLKTVHIIAGVLWLGNFAITGVWSVRAFATGEQRLRAFAVREILFTDAVFTFLVGGAVIMSGLGLAQIEHIPAMATFWTRAALITAVASGLAWLVWLLPLELRMRTLARSQSSRLTRVFVWWNIGGWSITVALFAIIYLMVAKPV